MVTFTIFSFFMNDFFKNQFPETYYSVVIYGTHKIIYFVSTLQIMTKKINNSLNPFFRSEFFQIPFITKLFTKNNDIKKDVEFIHNKKVIHLANINELTSEKNYFLNLSFKYDFIIYSKCHDISSKISDKIIFNKFPNKEDFNYENSNIKFILSELVIGDKSIKVDFKTDSYNYYIVNNVFEQSFLKFFIKEYYFDEIKDIENIEEKLDSMILKIIDHNASTETFDKENIVKIEKKNYKKIHLL